ncbi:hypothetical protein FQR65_LT09797 [Abscondita terminalis]|nr:hypothetical protein FQR65_LT09797 [Abscondita terminalis]
MSKILSEDNSPTKIIEPIKNKKKKNFNSDEALDSHLESLAPAVKTFLRTQIRLAKKHPKKEDIIWSRLILHKQSGKSYKMLSRIFCLPSTKRLSNLLTKIPIICGINRVVFDTSKETVQELRERDERCVLLFDEVSIDPHIDVNVYKTGFEGFVDKTNTIADHALVFLRFPNKAEKKQVSVRKLDGLRLYHDTTITRKPSKLTNLP